MRMAILTASLVCLCAWSAGAAEPMAPAKVQDSALRDELLVRMQRDQDARLAMVNWSRSPRVGDRLQTGLSESQRADQEKITSAIEQIDRENTKWLSEVIESHGWPTKTLVGEQGAHAAWLLVQHADANREFQRECLDLMAKLPQSEVSQVDFAYLTDRVQLAEGKKQIFGTQLTALEGGLQPKNLEDPTNVDQRRAKVGLQPLAKYIEETEAIYAGRFSDRRKTARPKVN